MADRHVENTNKSENDLTLDQLLGRLVDGRINAEQMLALETMLSADPESRKRYVHYLDLHEELLARANQQNLSAKVSTSEKKSSRFLWNVLTATTLAASLIFALFVSQSFRQKESNPVIAKIVDTSDAAWGSCTLPTVLNSELGAGRLRIERGLVSLLFTSGAKLTVEAPAEIELKTPMLAVLHKGAAHAEVPDSAHGFTLNTPNMVAIDHGTEFSVSVNPKDNTSMLEVIDGEVEVKHSSSNVTKFLTEDQSIIASNQSLTESEAIQGEPNLLNQSNGRFTHSNFHRITTATGTGREGTVIRGHDEALSSTGDDLNRLYDSKYLLVKNADTVWDRKGYLAFDLSEVEKKKITKASLVLSLRPSGKGFASRVPDCEFVVYGIIDESLEDWTIQDLKWSNAPANLDHSSKLKSSQVLKLGGFTVTRGRQHGQFSINSQELLDFLNSDTNKGVTLVIVRNTKELQDGGTVHAFASRLHPTATPPTLLLQTK